MARKELSLVMMASLFTVVSFLAGFGHCSWRIPKHWLMPEKSPRYWYDTDNSAQPVGVRSDSL